MRAEPRAGESQQHCSRAVRPGPGALPEPRRDSPPRVDLPPGGLCSESDGIGIAGPRLLSADGRIQSSARRFPDPSAIAARRTPWGRTRAGRAAIERHMPHTPDDNPTPVDWLVGAAMFVTARGREAFGLMSERYFLYFEDVEMCWRAWENGFEVWYVPDAVMEHESRRESAGRPGRALWLHLRSMVRFYTDHPGALTGRCPRPC